MCSYARIHKETVECIHVACSALQDECHCLLQLTKYMYDDTLHQKLYNLKIINILILF